MQDDTRLFRPARAALATLLVFQALCTGLPAAPAISATKDDGVAAAIKKPASSTVTYTHTISNGTGAGITDATGVQFADPDVANTTYVPNTLTATPLAIDDVYPSTVIANTSIDTATSGYSVVTNDFAGYSAGSAVSLAALTITNVVTPAHGALVMTLSGAGVGRFVYTPTAGYVGADSFTYSISNNVAGGTAVSRTATVNLTVGGPVIWFVNPALAVNGTGILGNPFNNLAAAVTAVGASINQRVFLFSGGAAQTTGIALNSGGWLVGQAAVGASFETLMGGISYPSDTTAARPAINNAAKPSLTRSAGDTVVLAQNNTILGLAIANSGGGFGINGAAINALTLGNDVSLSSSSTSSGALSLTGGGNGSLAIGIPISSTGGRSINIGGRTGGSVTFSGAIGDTGTGINLTGNTGATIAFTGGLSLSTGTNTAFNATGGGTVTATQNNSSIVNTITTTTATALNVANTTIGASGLTFRSINSNGGTSNGLSLDTTGSSGGLAVVGDGSNTSLGGDGTGGTIQNKSGSDGSNTNGVGIYLNNTASVVLRRMTVNGTIQNFGIRGFGVNGFTMEYCTVGGTLGTSNSGIGEGGVYFGDPLGATGVTGTSVVTSCNISGGRTDNFSVHNTSGTLNRMTVTNSNFGLNQTGANDSLAFEARNLGTTLNATVTGCTFTGAPGDLASFVGQIDAAMDVVFQNNTCTNSHLGNNLGGGGLTFAGFTATTINVSNNSLRDADGSAISLQLGAPNSGLTTATSFSGTVNNNTIGVTGVVDSGSKSGNGIFFSFADNSTAPKGQVNLAITNNIIRRCSGNAGIYADNTGGNYDLKLTCTGNTVAEPGAGAFAGFAMAAGAPTSTDDIDIFAKITDNDFSTGDPSNANDIVVGVSSGLSSIKLAGAGAPADGVAFASLAAVQTFLLNNNNSAGTTVVAYTDAPATAANFFGAGATSPPLPSTLLFASGGIEAQPLAASIEPAVVTTLADVSRPSAILTPSVATAVPQPEAISQAELDAVVASSIARWEASGLTEAQLKTLRNLHFEVTALTDSHLGEAGGNLIRVDANAGGNGWFVDVSDSSDSMFGAIKSATRRYTDEGGLPAGRVDLLTTILHEMGHALGLADSYNSQDRENIMFGQLTKGERRTPTTNQASGAKPFAGNSSHFLTGGLNPITIGTLPPGKSVVITYDVVIDNPFTLGATQLSSQATVQSSNAATILTDDPTVGGASDPTITLLDRPDTTVASINRATASPTNTNTVSWSVTFANAISGLTGNNFLLVASALGGTPAITSVTPTGGAPATVWTVTASTGTGSGTLGLNMANDTTLSHDVTNQPLTGQVYTMDRTVPGASIALADTALQVGDTSGVTVIFTEAVNGFTNADLTAPNGTLSAVATSDNITWTATFTPTAGITATTNVITLDKTGVADAAGNAGVGSAVSPNYTVDTARPTATIVVAANNLTIGETSLVTISFSEPVTGFSNADLTVGNGTLTPVSSGDGGTTWTATLTPTPNVTVANNVITLDNTGVADAAGNTGTGTTNSNNYAVTSLSISIAANSASIAEGTGAGTTAFTFTVSRTGSTAGAVTMNYAVTGAANAADFGGTLPSGVFTIPDTQASAVLTVNVSKDATVEPNENFTVTLSNASGGYAISTAAASSTISNDDSATLTVAKVNDGAETNTPTNGLFRITQSAVSSTATAVSYTVSGTATSGSDYTALPLSATIPAGSTTADIAVTVLNESTVEPTETVLLTLTGFTAGDPNVTLGAITASANITDDDTTVITLAPVIADQNEGTGAGVTNFTFSATSSNPVQGGFSLGYTTNNGTATAASDYTDNDGTLNFSGSANESKTITVAVTRDAINEADETFNVALGSFTNLAVGINPAAVTTLGSPGIGTIRNDDVLIVSIAATDASADDGTGDTGTWRFTRNSTTGATTIQLQVDQSGTVSAADGTQSGAALSSLAPGTTGNVVIPDGLSSVDVTLNPTIDLHAEAAETVRLNILADAAYTIGTPANATITIAANGFVVANTNDSGEGTLRQALLNSDAIAGADTVTFSNSTANGAVNFYDGTARTITLGGTELNVTSSVTISGPGAGQLAVSGNDQSRILSFSGNTTNTIVGLTLRNGRTNILIAGPNGILVSGGASLTLNRCSVSANTIGYASGAIAVGSGSSLTLFQTSVVGNSSSRGVGGGIYIDSGANGTVIQSTVSGNGARSGGGGISNSGSLVVIQSTVSGNSSQNNGGGIFNRGSLTLLQSTISGNSTLFDGGGIYSDGGTLSLANSIVADSTSSLGGSPMIDVFMTGVPVTLNLTGKNLIEDASIPAGSNVINGDPKLGPLQNNGGPTLTQALLDGSPAINAGDNASIPADANDLDGDLNTTEPIPYDQRGVGFTRTTGVVDIGAVEAQKLVHIAANAVATTEGTGAGNTAITFTVTRVGSSSGVVTMNYAVTGAAVNAADFGGSLPSGTFTIPDTQASAVLTINVSQDSTVEPDETFTVALSNASGGYVITTGSASSTITNDDFAADLAITVTDGVTTATPGGSVTYTIVASNVGPHPAPAATLSDTFPASLTATWTAVGAGGATAPAAGSGNINASVSLPVGGSVTFTVSATISPAATGTLSNTATISSSVTDPVPGNNSATDNDTLTPQANLAITKTDGVTTATPGGSVTYTIVASNAGPSNVTGATVADTLPASIVGATWTGAGAGGGTGPASGSGNINANAVNLPAGGSFTFTVTAPIASTATGTLSNTATVTPPGGVTDPTPGNNSATDTDTLTPQADLAVTITDSPDPVNAGGNLTYTIVLTHNGPSTAVSPTVSLPLPASTTFVSATAAAGWTTTAPAVGGTGTVGFSIASLASGGTATFTVVAKVDLTVVNNSTLTATATTSSATTDPTPGNNSVTTTTLAKSGADLQITLADSPDPVIAGTNLTYTLQIANNGPLDADNVSITDTLPAGTTFVSLSTPLGWTATTPAVGTTGLVTITKPLFANSGSGTFTLVVKVGSAVTNGTILSDTASVTSTTLDIIPGNNSATTTTKVSTQSNLLIDLTGTPDTAPQGSNVTYNITLRNFGPSDASAAAASFTLPAQMTFVSLSKPVGWMTAAPPVGSSGTVDFSAPSLANGAIVNFTVVAKVTTTTANGTLLTAIAAVGSATVDPAPSSNSDSVITAIGTLKPSAVQPVTTGIKVTTQTGLFDVNVKVTNTTPLPINGFRLRVNFDAYKAAYPSLRLENATSTSKKTNVYIDYPTAMAVGATVTVKLSFYTSTRTFPSPFVPALTVDLLATSQAAPLIGGGVQPSVAKLPNQAIQLAFPTITGRWYRVRYSADLVTWTDCQVPVQAVSTTTLWQDSGPPYTVTAPAVTPSRFYLVSEIAAP